jgi:hypothetical protein
MRAPLGSLADKSWLASNATWRRTKLLFAVRHGDAGAGQPRRSLKLDAQH